jgi:hypothetical protein
MPTAQEQYTQMVRQVQDSMLAAFEAWTRTWQQAFGQLPAAAPIIPEQVIDQGFDFAGKLLNAQRDFTKQLVGAGTAAAEAVRSSAAQAAEASRSG